MSITFRLQTVTRLDSLLMSIEQLFKESNLNPLYNPRFDSNWPKCLTSLFLILGHSNRCGNLLLLQFQLIHEGDKLCKIDKRSEER